jgi:hypothetical protein
LERGHHESLSLRATRRIAAQLDVRVELVARWRAGDLDRLVNARHSRLHELVAGAFRARYPSWTLYPEVSFSIYGERGVIDVLAWNARHRALLVVELKTDITDVNELLGTFDRKLRLARQVADERGLEPLTVSGWVVVAPGRTNRERITAHRTVLRAVLPKDGREIAAWLRRPAAPIRALSMWRNSYPGTTRADVTPVRRVKAAFRPRRTAP